MRRRCGFWRVAMGCAIGAAIASMLGIAHRAVSLQLDGAEPVTVQGWVTSVEWTQPHTYFNMDVVGDDGELSRWAFEMGSAEDLQALGWTRRSLHVGDEVEVDGFLVRGESPLVNVASVRLLGTGEQLQAMALTPTD